MVKIPASMFCIRGSPGENDLQSAGFLVDVISYSILYSSRWYASGKRFVLIYFVLRCTHMQVCTVLYYWCFTENNLYMIHIDVFIKKSIMTNDLHRYFFICIPIVVFIQDSPIDHNYPT